MEQNNRQPEQRQVTQEKVAMYPGNQLGDQKRSYDETFSAFTAVRAEYKIG